MSSAVQALTGPNAAIDRAIAQFEGFGSSNAPTITNANNPGGLTPGTFATQYGAIGSTTTASGQPVAVFPNVATGNAAEDALIQKYIDSGASLNSLISAWAPSNAPGNTPQSTQNYQAYAASQLGINPTLPLNSLNQSTTTIPSIPNIPPNLQGQAQQSANQFNQSPAGSGGLASLQTWAQLSIARIGVFVLGLICVAGGLYLFKPIKEVVNKSIKMGAEATIL